MLPRRGVYSIEARRIEALQSEELRAMLQPDIRGQLRKLSRAEMTARREEVKGDLSWDEPIAQTIALYERVIRENAEKLQLKSRNAEKLNGGPGTPDIEGKAARVAASDCGQRSEFQKLMGWKAET